MASPRTSKLTRRTVVKGGLGAAAGAAIHSKLASRSRAAQGTGEVTFMNWEPVPGTPFETAINLFQEQTDITVNVLATPTQDYDTRQRTLFASGNPPDLMRIDDDFVPGYAEANELRDLAPYAEAAGLIAENFVDATYTFALRPDGSRPAWSIGATPRLFFYNATMFEEAGVLPPPGNWTGDNWQWSDFLETAQQLTVPGERWGTLIYHDNAYEQVFPVNNGNQTGIFSEDALKLTLADPLGIEAVQWVADLTCRHGVQPPWSQLQQNNAANQLFLSGRVGMLFTSMSVVPYLRENVKDFTWDTAPVPAKAAQRTGVSQAVFCIPTDAQNPDAAWQLLQFLSGPEAATIFAEAGTFIPAWREASALIRPGDQPPAHVGLFGEAANQVTLVHPSPNQGRAEDIYRPPLDLVYTCQQSAEEALTSVREQTEMALAGEL